VGWVGIAREIQYSLPPPTSPSHLTSHTNTLHTGVNALFKKGEAIKKLVEEWTTGAGHQRLIKSNCKYLSYSWNIFFASFICGNLKIANITKSEEINSN